MDADSEGLCALCHRLLSLDTEAGDFETIGVCGDCKFLLLEDIEMPASNSRRRYSSSESVESMFSQQFSQLITLARQNQSASVEHDSQSVDGDGVARVVRRSISRTSRGGRRMSRRVVLSDSESDGFDSLYGGESESNVSFRRYTSSRGEGDTISYNAYDGDSDASADDGQSFLENENIGHSGLESDTDIDPMNAGLYHWNSDEDDNEWEGDDTMGNTPESLLSGAARFHGINVDISGRRQPMSPEVEGAFSFRALDWMQLRSDGNFEEFVAGNYAEDDIDSRGFEDLAETENARRGAPPASASFVSNIASMTIKEDKLTEGVACAICKEFLTVGTVVNQLPCFHLYHPYCILPWLSARNTCPLCRYELPTEDNDYEARKRSRGNEEMDHPDEYVVGGPSDGERSSGGGDAGARRNGWLLAAAAPVVSFLGISLMLWFNSSSRRCPRDSNSYIPCSRSQTQRRRSWWWLYL